MVFTDVGRKMMTLSMGSDVGLYIAYVGIGSGSGTALVTNTALLHERDRNVLTGSPNFTVAQKATFQSDFGSSEMSGTHLTEFGLTETVSGTGFPGSMWLRESFGSIVFDGTNELQVVSTIHVQ